MAIETLVALQILLTFGINYKNVHLISVVMTKCHQRTIGRLSLIFKKKIPNTVRYIAAYEWYYMKLKKHVSKIIGKLGIVYE